MRKSMKLKKTDTKVSPVFECQEKVVRPTLQKFKPKAHFEEDDVLLLGQNEGLNSIWHGYIEFPHDETRCPIALSYAKMYTFDRLAHLYDDLKRRTQNRLDESFIKITQSTLQNRMKEMMEASQQMQIYQAKMQTEREQLEVILRENQQIDRMIEELIKQDSKGINYDDLISTPYIEGETQLLKKKKNPRQDDSVSEIRREGKESRKIIEETGRLLRECKSIIKQLWGEMEGSKKDILT